MTGRHPFRVNVPNHGHYLRPHETTVAEALGSAGYVTGHFGKWHIGSVQKESATSPGGAGFDEWLSGLNFFDNDPYLSRNGEYGQFKGPGSVIAMDATIEFLRKHVKGDKPIFAVTWFPSPHDPQSELPQGLPNAATLYNDKDTKKPGYFREITLLDQQIGKLRKSLRQLGIAENTLLFYCSDNGGLVAESSGGRAKRAVSRRRPACARGDGMAGQVQGEDRRHASVHFRSVPHACRLGRSQGRASAIARRHRFGAGDRREFTERPPMGFWHGHTQGQGTWNDRIIKALFEAKSGPTQPASHARSEKRK